MLSSELKIAIRFTLLTTVVLGILYPLAVTGIGQRRFAAKLTESLLFPTARLRARR